jgi:hypothetical protein
MRLLTVIPELQPFLSRIRLLFSREQFRYLARYLIGLIGSRKRKTNYKHHNKIVSFLWRERNSINHLSLNRFINSSTWNTETLSLTGNEKDRPRGSTGTVLQSIVFIIIDDDTLLP